MALFLSRCCASWRSLTCRWISAQVQEVSKCLFYVDLSSRSKVTWWGPVREQRDYKSLPCTGVEVEIDWIVLILGWTQSPLFFPPCIQMSAEPCEIVFFYHAGWWNRSWMDAAQTIYSSSVSVWVYRATSPNWTQQKWTSTDCWMEGNQSL